MTNERLQAKDYLIIALVIAIFAVASIAYQNTQHFSFDQQQMLLKGFHALFTGEYLPWGNEASALGNLPMSPPLSLAFRCKSTLRSSRSSSFSCSFASRAS